MLEVVAAAVAIGFVRQSIARAIRLGVAALLAVGFIVWCVLLVGGDKGTGVGAEEFWQVVAALAPTLAIAYAVTISDAVRTYQAIRQNQPEAGKEELRVTAAFVGGSIGAFFGLLQAVVVGIALSSVFDHTSRGSPVQVIIFEVTAMVFAPLVPFLAHGWSPWNRSPTSSASDRGDTYSSPAVGDQPTGV